MVLGSSGVSVCIVSQESSVCSHFCKSVKNKFLYTMTATPAKPSPIPENTGLIVRHPMGLPITAGCDTARGQTRVCSDDLNHCATRGSGKEGRTLAWTEQGSAIVIGILDLSVFVFVRAMCFLATICVGLQTIEMILPVKYMKTITVWQGCDTKIQVTMRPYSEYFHSPSSLQASKQVRTYTHQPRHQLILSKVGVKFVSL
jgi:hypothetical protein